MMTKVDHSRDNVVSPIFQLVFIALGAMVLTGTIMHRLNQFRAFESRIPLENFSPQVIKDFGGAPNEVRVGMSIHSFKIFDVPRNSFHFTAAIWFLFVPGSISLPDLEKFDFMHSVIEYRSPPITTKVADKIMITYYVKASLAAQLNYQDFPLDDHRIYLTLINTNFFPVEMLFNSTYDDLVVAANVENFGWNLIDKRVRTGYVKVELNEVKRQVTDFPAVAFILDYSQFSSRNLIALFIPLLVICYVGLFSFSLGQNVRLPVISGAVTATLGYRYVIEALSPRVGYYMMVDKVFLLTLLINSFALLLTIVETYAVTISITVNKIFVAIFHITLIFALIYIIR